MKLSFPWRRRPAEESKPAAQTTPATADAPIDVTIPRECHLRSFEGQPGPCPRCGGLLHRSRQSYLVTTRRGRHIADSFYVGSDFGWFCVQCPTVVINTDQLNEMLETGLPHWDIGNEFAVLGIVDLDAIPEDRRELPLGDDGNPIPLVKFTYPSNARSADRPALETERTVSGEGPRDDEQTRLALKKLAEAERKAKAQRKREKAMRRKQRKQRSREPGRGHRSFTESGRV
ncbi:MAG: hypothetical protein HY023_11770 [Chloroflexi bacterium]|nr:hypothetical protein [Chloroflexota bacterium]